jgi:hypothetical protein
MNIKILAYIIFCLLSIKAIGQTSDSTTNQLNERGKKEGLWIENKGMIMAYYKNGIKDGVYINYNRKNGRIHAFGEYKQDFPSGKWYFFNDEGILLFTEENIEKNTKYKRMRDDGVEITPMFTSYVTNYYPNGYIKEEGRVLYSEDIEIDYFKTGTWKYYNKQGKLEQTKEH